MKLGPLLMASLFIASTAHAYPVEDRGALTGGSSTSGLALSDDGRYVATSQRSEGAGLAVWDRLAPGEGPLLVDVCEAVDVVWTSHATLGDAFYVACGTNEIVRIDLDTSTTPPTARAGTAIAVGAETETNVALAWATGDDVVHVTANATSVSWLHVVDIATDGVDMVTGLPASDQGTPIDVVLPGTTGLTPVVVAQSDGSLFWMSRSGTTWTSQAAQTLTGTTSSIAADPAGIADFLLLTTTDGEAWALDQDSPGAFPTQFDDELTSPVASAFVAQSSGSPVVWIAGNNNTVDIFDTSGTWLEAFDLSSTGAPVAMVGDPASTDTVWVAGGDGTVRVVTDRPWVTSIAVEPEAIGEGDDFTVTFEVDVDCDYDLRIDSGISSSGGTSLSSGTATAAEAVTVTLASTVLTGEGDNRLVLFATDNGSTGVDSTVITLDTTPPEAVTGFTAEPGDARLLLEWTSTDEEDIETFRVYVSDEAFAKTDTELPSFSLVDEDGETIDYPLDLTAGAASSAHSTSITGLTNDATYWVAIQAIDAAENEGPLSDVLEASPEQTCGLVECYGPDPGCSCSTSPSPAPGAALLALVGVLLGLARRRV